ncbi:hypothetical protein GCM10009539_46980 [Cryptosporangium japonicum]|uniref:RNA polymerase sigma factor 70 region 4 type 2 domain-containing protein n=1 Tax=Cryptosporangium japonicum TaxID=80872 RepID=A0ABP3E951_9ACTN
MDTPGTLCLTVCCTEKRTASRTYLRYLVAAREIPVGEIVERGPLLDAGLDLDVWEQRHDILAALRALPERQRQVLAWTHDGFTPDQIATELGLTAAAVRASLYKGRRALAAQLARPGSEVSP